MAGRPHPLNAQDRYHTRSPTPADPGGRQQNDGFLSGGTSEIVRLFRVLPVAVTARTLSGRIGMVRM